MNGSVRSCSSSIHGVKEKYISSTFPNRYKKNCLLFYGIYTGCAYDIHIFSIGYWAIKDEL